MALVFGIDTGSWRVRVASKEGSFGRFTLRDVQEMATPAPVAGPAGGEAAPPWAEAVAAFRGNEPGWDGSERTAAWPLDEGVVRLVRLPFTDRASIARALPAEVEAQVPYDLDDMHLVTHVVDAKDNASRTLAFIAPTDGLKARIAAFAAVGSEPKQVVFDAQAIAAWASGDGAASRGVVAVVDVGHERTLIALCQNGALVGARAIAHAGAMFTAAIARATGQSEADAEALKHTLSVPAPTTVDWDDRTDGGTQPGVLDPARDIAPETALGDAVDVWAAELRAELIALEDESQLGVDDVLLVGGSARLAGLSERLAARIGVATRPASLPGGYGPECALVLGLTRIGAGEAKATDLRIGGLGYHGHADTLWNFFAASTLGAVVAAIAATALLVVQYTDGQSRLHELDDKIKSTVTTTFPDITADKLTSPSIAVALMQEKVAATTARVDALGSTISGVPPTLDMLKTLSEHMPATASARIDVKELTIAAAAVTMKAETDSYESAATIEASIQSEPRFKGAKKADEKKVGDALSFSLTIPLNQPEAATDGTGGGDGAAPDAGVAKPGGAG